MDAEQPKIQPDVPSSPPEPARDDLTPVTQPQVGVPFQPVQTAAIDTSVAPETTPAAATLDGPQAPPATSTTQVQPTAESQGLQQAVEPSISSEPAPVVQPAVMPLSNSMQSTAPQMTASPAKPNQPSPVKSVMHNKRKLALIGGAFIFALVLAIAVYYAFAHASSQNKVADLERQLAVVTADTHDLPENAIQVSECIPNMGFHYIDPTSDSPFGPYYLVNKQGKVIGFEYMFNDSMLTSVPAEIDLEVLLTDGPISLHGWQYETIEFARSPSGHPGFEDDHIDVHIYTVTPEEQKRSCE